MPPCAERARLFTPLHRGPAPCGGFVIDVAGGAPPVLKLLVADNQEIDSDIERANEPIQADHFRKSVGGLFHDHDVEVAMRSSVAPGVGAKEDDPLRMGGLDEHAGQPRNNQFGSRIHTDTAPMTSLPQPALHEPLGGPGRVRTDDLFHAMEARSQLRHRPNWAMNKAKNKN